MGVSGQHQALAMDPLVPTGYKARWASELVWAQMLEKKILCLCRDQTLVVQSVIKHYTDIYKTLPGQGNHINKSAFE
jgi:hypothetical protein